LIVKEEQIGVQVQEIHVHRVHQRSEEFQTLGSQDESAFTSRDVIFDENLMLQEKLEIDKVQGGALDSSSNSQV